MASDPFGTPFRSPYNKMSFEDQSKNLIALLQCPSCGKSSDQLQMITLTSCGHHYCNKCCDKFVHPTGKCPSCFTRCSKAEMKDDQFMTSLMKCGNQMEQIENKRQLENIQTVEQTADDARNDLSPTCYKKGTKLGAKSINIFKEFRLVLSCV